jgi:hypothetical protein
MEIFFIASSIFLEAAYVFAAVKIVKGRHEKYNLLKNTALLSGIILTNMLCGILDLLFNNKRVLLNDKY